jgi:hypothetical protein
MSNQGATPLQNRVTPAGEIVAVAARGTLMGNRGILHDQQRRLVRTWQVKRWIACRLEFRGRHRDVLRPGSYTELFFLDEATALAAGHRPCAECRHADYGAFQAAWRLARPDVPAVADAMDAALHQERRPAGRSHSEPARSLPDGVFVNWRGRPYLIWSRRLLEWSAEGYRSSLERPGRAELDVLTPPSLVRVLRAGYAVSVHPSAAG